MKTIACLFSYTTVLNRMPAQIRAMSVILVFASILGSAARASCQEMKHVLVIHSYHKGLTWTDSEDSGIRSVLRKRMADVEVHTEYIDSKTIADEEHYQRFYELVKHKFASIALNAVIVSDDDAYTFYLKHQKELFPGVPMVFCGVNYYQESQLVGREDLVTGVVEAFDIPGTLRTALRLQPRTSRVIVINDLSTTGLANKKNINEEVVPHFSGKVRFEFFEDLSMDELLRKVRSLSSDDIILMMTFNKDRTGKVFNYDQSIALIASAARVPIYGVWDFYLGNGIVGGMLTSGMDQGSMAADMALRILDGEKVRDIPVVKNSPNRYKFDYRQMQRFGISVSELPPGSMVINEPVSFYVRHKIVVWGVISGFLALSLIILLLLAIIRQRRKAEKTLRESETKFRTLIHNVNVGVYRATLDGRYLQANPAMAKIFGYETPEQLMETQVIDIYRNPEERGWFLEELQAKREVRNVEIAMQKRDETPLWASLSVTAQYDEQDNIASLDGVLEDITERKRSEDELYRLNEELEMRVRDRTKQLESANTELQLTTEHLDAAYQKLKSAQSQILQQEKMASIGQLAAGVAHEINNPMAFIISNLSSLRKYSEKVTGFIELQSGAIHKLSVFDETLQITGELEKQKKVVKLHYVLEDMGHLIDESLEGAERVRKIVQDLKSFSRLDEAEFKVADINQGLESTINMVSNEIKYKATLNRQFGTIPQTACNLGQLNQVFMNILVNASHAIEAQGEIAVSTTCDDSQIYITISDTGAGIPPDKLTRIFEPFYTTKEVGKGTGLGLSIAYDIIKKHNGEIRVESEVGKGTVFTIVIPVVDA
jgi:PAS domain S-box-containing protein